MTEQEANKRAVALRKEISALRYRYHVENDPSVTDDVYDSLTRELRAIETQYPTVKVDNDPLARVAGAPLDKFSKVTHSVRMLSLSDVFSLEELEAWEKRIQKLVPDETLTYFAELKFDGLAVTLLYKDGVFVRGATRGDGFVGEDITENIKMIADIPLSLTAPYPAEIEVRGEVLMSKAVWEKLNKQNEKEGKPLFANTRNATAGSVRQLDPQIAKERQLSFYAYDIAALSSDFKKRIHLHSDEHRLLLSLGFPVSEHEKKCNNINELEKFIAHIKEIRPTYAYGTDGVVISVDDLATQKRLGVVGKAPRYMAAYKYPAERATTVVRDITVQVGRTGVLTPLAHFDPTLVHGSTVSKATLHNMDQIARLDLRIGDTVVIQKAGDVIPEVVEVITSLRTGKEKKFAMPRTCPECGGGIEKKEGATKEVTVAYYCTNKQCPAKDLRRMIHFVNAFEIYTVGPKILERLKDEGLITDVADLFTLTEADLSGLERFGEKSAKNIVENIQERKHPTLARFITALGIVHVGEETARDLATHFGTLFKFLKGTREDFDMIENIGPAVTSSILAYLADPHERHLLEKFASAGVVPQTQKKVVGGALAGKVFVLSGTLPTLSREDAKKMILEAGGKVAGSVSKNTNYVLLGENAGSKQKDAEKLGIAMLDEQSFLKMLG
jgi:DNA ligase (NAD+)